MCTRILYETGTGTFITGRGMDWSDPTAPFSIFSFPRGLERTGAPVDNTITWRAKYGSVVCSMYGAATADGMNEQGLVANVLYKSMGFVVTEEGPAEEIGFERPSISMELKLGS